MHIPVSEAKAQLIDLVRHAEAGDEIVLTRHGRPAVRLVRANAVPTSSEKRALMESVRASGRKNANRDVDSARSQDFLYDEDGLPARGRSIPRR